MQHDRGGDMKSRWIAVMLGLTLVAATVAAPAASEPQAAAGSFDLQATFDLMSMSVPCPADVPPATTECRALTGWSGDIIGHLVQGLGWVSEATYTVPLGLGPPACPAGFGKPLATTGRLIVEGKGEIAVAVSEGARCVASRARAGRAAGVHDHRWHRPVRRGLRERDARPRVEYVGPRFSRRRGLVARAGHGPGR